MPVVYSRINILIHWLMAVLMAVGWFIGSQLEDMPRGPDKLQAVSLHAVIGMAIFVLLMARIAALHLGGPKRGPALDWKDKAARLGHAGLYFAMLVLPLSGMAMMLLGKAPFAPFGLMALPYIGENHDLREVFEGVHGVVANLFLFLVIVHVGATIWHQVILKDDVAGRMLPHLRRNNA